MGKVTPSKAAKLWGSPNPPRAISDIATALEITPARVRQIIGRLGMKPIVRVGNVPFYSHVQYLLLAGRNTKPGPATNGKKGKR